jgi:antitoxin FitA
MTTALSETFGPFIARPGPMVPPPGSCSALLAFCMQQHHNARMAISITIRNLPDAARNELAARAATAGQSLQEYLRAQLIELASRPDVNTVLARIAERKRQTKTDLSAAQILADRDADRR